ncbi:GNAT family N-acetyltransferase [Lederbergia panacisoli]|uniref:GNAT family N-acetyltransferase n=1 Tax=Lederbergia panacisoli TaxID=1255251 RepID=UPI00214B2CD3|nr:GNAT family N-acetyltransferase [Lederbergia panacisoli]MCR2821725.1 GNAT family N-acetyltransferase [Lederbergia panacisoli]
MQNIQIQTLQEFSGETKELVIVWNQNLADSFPISESLFERGLIKNPWIDRQNSYIALEDDQLIGFLISKKDRELEHWKGQVWLSAFLVDKHYRQNGIGNRLFKLFEDQIPIGTDIMVGSDPYHLFPGIPSEQGEVLAFLEKRGFQVTDKTYDLRADISEHKEQYPLDHMYSVRRLKEGEQEELISLFEKEFEERWVYHLTEGFANNERKIDGTIGLFKDNTLIGFANVSTFNDGYLAPNVFWRDLLHKQYSGLGPIGVAKGYRGKGLGVALLEKAVLQLQREGVKEMVVDWTVFVDYYGKVGCKPWKEYVHVTKTV